MLKRAFDVHFRLGHEVGDLFFQAERDAEIDRIDPSWKTRSTRLYPENDLSNVI